MTEYNIIHFGKTMSKHHITHGVIAELEHPIDMELLGEDDEAYLTFHYEQFGITNNGKFIYTESYHDESWKFEFTTIDKAYIEREIGKLNKILEKHKMSIKGEIKPYIQHYFSNTDSSINMVDKI